MRPVLNAILLAVLLLALGLPGVPPSPAAAASSSGVMSLDPDDVRNSRDAVLDGRYQTEPPEKEERTVREPLHLPAWLAELLFWMMVIAVTAVVLFFLYNLISDLLRNRGTFKINRDTKGDSPARIATPPSERRAVDPHTLAEADRLAAAGHFSEAIHLLLLVAMARLHRELGPRVAPAMTSREVLRLPALPGNTVEPLTRMVQAAEINHFGGRSAAEPDYRRCRADFLRFNGEPAAA